MLNPIAHRICTIEEIKSLPHSVGLEFDIHAYKDELKVCHDPFVDGFKLSDFLNECHNRGTLAINIKEEGIEIDVINAAKSAKINNFFLFDVPFPQITRLGEQNKEYMCLRYSDIEKLDLDICSKFAKFLWIDTFSGNLWMEKLEYTRLKELGYKLCFVSPEVHRPAKGNTVIFSQAVRSLISADNSSSDFICTKE